MNFLKKKKSTSGNSLVVQWLGLCTFTAEGLGSIPDRGTKIPRATQHSPPPPPKKRKAKKENLLHIVKIKWTMDRQTVSEKGL